MRKIVLATLAAAALFATGSAASAQIYYSGPGFGAHIGPRYEEPVYRRGWHRHHDRRYYRARSGTCRPGFTVQDGRCKPYTGR
jgi:hypothetical protein